MAALQDVPPNETWFMGIGWAFVGLVLIFLALRIYTRIHFISVYGLDDYAFVASCVFFFANMALEQVAAYVFPLENKCLDFVISQLSANLKKNDSDSGLARVATLTDPAQTEKVILYQICAGTLCGLYTACAKASVGLFLLRIVFERWQRIAIWISIIIFFIWAVPGKSAPSHGWQ